MRRQVILPADLQRSEIRANAPGRVEFLNDSRALAGQERIKNPMRPPMKNPDKTIQKKNPPPTRRDFLQRSGAAAVGGSIATVLPAAKSAHAAGGDTLRLGLIGCGGRGSGAAVQALRADFPRADGTMDAFRIPLLRPGGQHGIFNPQPFREFDADAYTVNQTMRFLATGGDTMKHESGCDCSADGLPNFTLRGSPEHPTLAGGCTVDDLRVCDSTCSEAWGLWMPEESACEPPPSP